MLHLTIPSNLENMRRLNGNFTDFLTKLLDHLFHQCSHFSVLSAHWFLAGIHSANYDPEISKCAWPTSKFLVFPHITSKPLLTGGFGDPTSGCVCSRLSVLEFAPSRGTPGSYLICTTGGSSSPVALAVLLTAGQGIPGNSSQWRGFTTFSDDVKLTHVFGRVTAH